MVKQITLTDAQEASLLRLLAEKKIEISRYGLTRANWHKDGIIETMPLLASWKLAYGELGGCECGCDRSAPQLTGQEGDFQYTIDVCIHGDDHSPETDWLFTTSPSRSKCWDCIN